MASDLVRKIRLEDVPEFIKLQDEFVVEHHKFTQKLYGKVSIVDWQHCLLCPERIMKTPGGREKQIIEMVKQENAAFRNLHVLVVADGDPAVQVGYIMFHVHKSKRSRLENGHASPPHVQVKQLFVRSSHRRQGLGSLLLDGMKKVAPGPETEDLRLSVLDLNEMAFTWYRSRGFVLTGVVWEYLGPQDNAHLVAYQVMQRLTRNSPGSVKSDKAILFRSEIIGEIVSIKYPDGSGPFYVTIRGWQESEKMHMVDSRNLSSWDGAPFTDLIDFNEAFTSGRASFHRELSLVMRDVEMTKLLAKEAKEKLLSADLKRKKQESPQKGKKRRKDRAES